ncbi:MAG: penicillin-binding protein 2 [Candidatus Parcubacteria bacterium]|uniref:penicillin-binding protein 2 n=1 Tax=Phormidesmis priestleyi TaxID=268141 RepID=UPI00083A9E70|nr:penicillin-binding protein 2 [Phormidesmis priestleyi]MBC7824203.1 penicillin-binding protein 2 [Leptolyngbyaceae cyanobacterium LF-bin-113]
MASGFSFVSTTSRINQTRSRRSHRSVLLFMVATTLISGCMFRLAQLQIVQGQRNRQLADQNRIRPLSIVADRGNILDRRGIPLAANQLSRSIYLYPREQSMQQWQDSAEKLSKILDVSAEEILKKLNQVGYRSAVPARIYRNLTPHQFVALAEGGQIPGLEIQAESSRHYPNGNLAAHILGYIGEATADDLKANPDFPMGMLLGQMGIERIADSSLRGKWGSHLLEVDSVGKELRMLGEQKPTSGSDLRLTLDFKLQKAAEKALNNQRGAVVALDVKTGAVLVMASGPTFDPNLFTRKISTQEWKDLQGQDHPFLNRSLQGYPPGSTFKIVTTSAGIQSGKFSPSSTLPTFSAINIGGTLFHEHGGAGYGTIGFRDALAFSSNTFFYQVGMAVGPDEISKWGHRLGIGETSSMGLEGGSHGVIPTPEQKQKLYGEPWYGGDTVSMSIGQGVVQVTPLELAVMVSAIANGGYRVKPHLMADQTNTPATVREATGLSPGTIEVIRQGLTAVVKEGTARRLSDGSIPPTAGKTGTAEVIGQRDNALYVGYGPLNDPQIAIAVVVENGGFGAESAVPIAHEIYKAYFGPPKSASPIK